MAPIDYLIELSEFGTITFPAVDFGYETQAARTVTISNLGIQQTGVLTVALGGTNANNFTLSANSISSIVSQETDSFTIRPNTGLAARTYTATVTVSGNNGLLEDFSISFTVRRAAGSTVAVPTPTNVTFNSITVNPVTPPSNGQTVQYAIGTRNNLTQSILTWQSEPTFTGLLSDTNYYVYARSAQNDNYNAGVAAVSSPIRTMINTNITDLETSEGLKIYPNPTNGEITIRMENGEWRMENVEFFDMNGKRVYVAKPQFSIFNSQLTINISHLPNGTYIVKIGNSFAKIIKQ
jgi:hypothetical protein